MSEQVLADYRAMAAKLTAPDGPFALYEQAGLRLMAGTRESLIDIYDDCAAQFGAADMLEADGQRWTFGQILDQAARLGAVLRAEHGVTPGDRVALASRNCPEWFIAFIAVTRIGAVAALVNSRAQGDEMRHACELTGARLAIADQRSAMRLGEAGWAGPILPVEQIWKIDARDADQTALRLAPDSPAAILFTSGTTGRSKGATISHRNLTGSIRLITYMARLGGELAAQRNGIDFAAMSAKMPKPSYLLSFPLFHISGMTNFLLSITNGALLTIMQRWEVEEAVRLIGKNKISIVQGAGLVLQDLFSRPDAARELQSVTSITVGGQATPQSLTAQVAQVLPHVVQGTSWGMTEVTGACTSASGPVMRAWPDSCGVVLPPFDLRLVGPDGADVPQGEPGEIWVRGPTIFGGYWNDEAATAAAFEDGWFKTGDMAFFNEASLMVMADRQKDMVISAGENIYCAEVERVLDGLGLFAEVALIGVPDARLGERAVAVGVLRGGVAGDAAAVQAAVGKQLADYKVPREVLFWGEPLPRNHVGKVDKVALRRGYVEGSSAILR